ncbi:MAG: hypothetical protein ACRD8O_22180 [Bryobacteraceae bacterium]
MARTLVSAAPKVREGLRDIGYNARMIRVAVLALFAVLCCAQVRSGKFHNRDAWMLETPAMRVTVMQVGGHIAEIVLKGGGAVNPLWVQKRPTIDASDYDPARHEKFYGGGSGARLMSGLLGHNVCFPFWGNPSPSEAKAGMTFHGETGVVRWKQVAADEGALTIAADLPESRTRLVRALRVSGQVVYFQSTGENLSAWDRPAGWCEHVTLGPPFLEKGVTVSDASLTRGRRSGDESGKEFVWPAGAAETAIDLRKVRDIERSGFVNNFLVDPSRELGFFAAVNPRLRVLFGYVFPRAEFPWLNIWEANNPDMLTRGMEFSNTPTHGSLKALVAAKPLFSTPMYEWLDAKAKLAKRFAAFSARVPAGYRGVADVRVSGERLEIVERETATVITLEFDGWGRP